MPRYTLQMGHSGGLSEYLEYFSALRKIFRIKDQRNELREEIQDVLALVESSYLDEQRRADFETAEIKAAQKRLERYREKREERDQDRFENFAAILLSLTLPLSVISALFGMNLRDFPVHTPFWVLVGIGVSIGLGLIISFFLYPRTSEIRGRKEGQNSLRRATCCRLFD